MSLSIRRVRALLIKEVNSLPKNKNVLIMALLPMVLCYAYMKFFSGEEGMNSFDILYLTLSMNLVLVSTNVVSMLIAEEKEKNTLRTLMLAGVSSLEFFLGKILVTLTLGCISNLVMFFLVDLDIKYLPAYALLTFGVSVCLISLGSVVGLLAQNQMATGVMGLPVMAILFIIPTLGMANDDIGRVAKITPTFAMKEMLFDIAGIVKAESGMLFNIIVLGVWIVGAILAFAVVFRKVGLDK